MRKKKLYSREEVLREMVSLALCPVNDVVKLCFLQDPSQDDLDRLDLTGLTEFKRNNSGTVELKFTDRLRALEALLHHLDGGREEKAAAFLRALEQPAFQDEEAVSRR